MSDFKELAAIDCSAHTEKKGKFTYLSWSWCHDYMAQRDPDFNWWVHDFTDAQGVTAPYMASIVGVFVRVSVVYKGKEVQHTYPVLNHTNKPISATDCTSFDVNNAIMRCFAKACGLHGLGLYIFSGEDLPAAPSIDDVPAESILIDFGKYKDMGMTLGEVATNGGLLGLGYIKWGAFNHKDPVMRGKFAEVWSKHSDPLEDDVVADKLQDVDDIAELKAIKTLLTDEQKESFADQLSAIEADLKG